MRRGLLIALLIAALPTPAQAVELVTSDGQTAQPYQRWADRAKVPTVDGNVPIHTEACPYLPGQPCTDGWSIWLPEPDRFVLLHELGHLFDWRVMSEAARRRFRLIYGWPPDAWDGETFANEYARCARWKPEGRRQRRTCALLRRVGLTLYESGITK